MRRCTRTMAAAVGIAAGMVALIGCDSTVKAGSGVAAAGSVHAASVSGATPATSGETVGGPATPTGEDQGLGGVAGPSASTPADPSLPSAPSSPPGPAAPSGPRPCTAAQLTVWIEAAPGGASAGHNGEVLEFRNAAGPICTLTGYPGVAGANLAGADLFDVARSPRGRYGGLPAGSDARPVLTLGHGATASAVVEWSTVPTGGDTSCPSFPRTLVTAPNMTVTRSFAVALSGCELTVHPVVSGMAGGGPTG
jgi:Protein of unknown function (DUF4232)